MKRLILILIVIAVSSGAKLSAEDKYPLAAYQEKGLWHFIDQYGKELFPPIKLNDVAGYKEGVIRGNIKEDNKLYWVYFNLLGKEICRIQCDYADNYSDGMALVFKVLNNDEDSKKFGFLDKNGKLAFDFIYDDAISFESGLAYVMNSQISGYINPKGEMVVPTKGMAGNAFKEGLADVNTSEFKIGFINTKGEMVIDFKYDETGGFSEGYANVNTNGKFGYIDKTGKMVIPAMYDYATPYSEGMAFIGELDEKFKTKWGLIDHEGKTLTEFAFDKVQDFSEGLAAVLKNGKWGFINKTGQYAIEPKYTYTDSFSHGLAWASDKVASKSGFINTKGELIIELNSAEKIVDLRLNRILFK